MVYHRGRKHKIVKEKNDEKSHFIISIDRHVIISWLQ